MASSTLAWLVWLSPTPIGDAPHAVPFSTSGFVLERKFWILFDKVQGCSQVAPISEDQAHWIRTCCTPRLHAHLVIYRAQIQFGKEAHPTQFIQDLIDHWNRKFILDSLFIEGHRGQCKSAMSCLFFTSRTGEENSESLGRMMPCVSNVMHCHSISSW